MKNTLPAEIKLCVQIVPGSSQNEIIGLQNDRLKIKIKAAPIEGKANEALIAFLAEIFKIPKSQVVFLKGQSSKLKTLLIKSPKIIPTMLASMDFINEQKK